MLLAAGCSLSPSGKEVIEQAHPGGNIAFDVVKIDENVLTTLEARPRASLRRLKEYVPSPELKIAVGDTV